MVDTSHTSSRSSTHLGTNKIPACGVTLYAVLTAKKKRGKKKGEKTHTQNTKQNKKNNTHMQVRDEEPARSKTLHKHLMIVLQIHAV
jgi:hypothetical protein